MEEESYLGEIRLFAGRGAPLGWHLCDGATLSINEYPALYALLGPTWGGTNTGFALPDLRGRVPISAGQGPGLSLRRLGEIDGWEKVQAANPPHTHAFNVSTKKATLASPKDALLGAVTTQGVTTGLYLEVEGTAANLGDDTILDRGEGRPHDNMMPSMALHYIICVQGLFPEQN